MSSARIRSGAACCLPGPSAALFVSFDDGDHWQPLHHGLPTTSVRDITIHGDDLVIATHGRGFYVLDESCRCARSPANAATRSASVSAGDGGSAERARVHRHADAEGRAAGAQPAAGAMID